MAQAHPAPKEIRLPAGTIRYRDTGAGKPLVFVHGLLVDGTLWRKVTPLLEGEFRCVVPDLPLGSHRVPMSPDADLSPPGVARIVADFIAALELEDVTLVGNDTGGAICQLVATEPSRAARAAGADAVRRVRELPAAVLPADAVRGQACRACSTALRPAGPPRRRAAQRRSASGC